VDKSTPVTVVQRPAVHFTLRQTTATMQPRNSYIGGRFHGGQLSRGAAFIGASFHRVSLHRRQLIGGRFHRRQLSRG